MGHTNSTANIALPQFIGTDKPTWLGDVNGAFAAIDSKVGTIDADVAAVDAKADTAVSDASAAVTTATNANNTAGTASTTATQANNIANNALTVANNADGHTNQLETKVGLLADLTTTDKTSIVNAINEVNAAGAPAASAVSYDNTGSGLTATNVQDALDEVAQGGGSGVTLKYTASADGVKTHAQLLNEIATYITSNPINVNAYLEVTQYSEKFIARVTSIDAKTFGVIKARSTDIQLDTWDAGNEKYYAVGFVIASQQTNYFDFSSSVADSSLVIKLYA